MARSNDEVRVADRLELITRGVAEVIGLDEIKEKLKADQNIVGYWGTAPTRSPSIGYLIPLMKFRDLVLADVQMKVLIADVHAFLDKGSNWIDRTTERTTYYIFLISEILSVLGVNKDQYEICKGSDVQLDKKYVLDLFKLLTHITVNQAKKAGSDVVKQNKEPTLSSLVYPLMQAIDETVLGADIELGGTDQRKIFALSRDHIEKLGYNKCSYVMNELLPSLSKPGTKMSSSDPNGKIEFTDTAEQIHEKIKKAYCVEKEVKDNPCLELARQIIYPMGFICGEYITYDELEAVWVGGMIYSQQLKDMLTIAINEIVTPIRDKIEANRELYLNAFS